MSKLRRKSPHRWADITIGRGQSREVKLTISESYSGLTMHIPVFIRRGRADGPTVFITAAIHGDEINGTGAIRRLIQDEALVLEAGTVILVPVVNILGFDRHSRYLPDRRDLNRSFPGSRRGSVAARMARVIFEEIVGRSDFGIDLHTAAVRRTNFPNVRADLTHAEVNAMAHAFGCELIINSKGPEGSLRREACAAGRPTIILEAGEVWKVEPSIVDSAVRGIRNTLCHLGMLSGKPVAPPYCEVIERTKWLRADYGGFLQFHVRPGDIVKRKAPVASSTSLVGSVHDVIHAPFDAFVLGMTTLPAIAPGDPVVHLGQLLHSHHRIERLRKDIPDAHLHGRILEDLATNITVVTPESPSPSVPLGDPPRPG